MNKTFRLVVDANALVEESRSALQDRLFAGAVGSEVLDALDIEKIVVLLTRCIREEQTKETV